MRIAIDLLIADKEMGGMLLAARALLAGLTQIDRTNEYIIITGRPKEYQELAAVPNVHIHAVKLHSWRGIMLQHQLLLPNILRRLQPDVLHIPAFAAPIGWHGPLVITVHDLGFLKIPEQTSLYTRFYWQHMLRESVRRAQGILAVSEQTRDELITHWTIPPERIHVVHNALRPALSSTQHISLEENQARQQLYGKRYLLHVGRIMPRKNVEILIQAFNMLAPRFGDLHIVLTGGAGYKSKEVLEQIDASPFRKRIHLVNWVSDQELGILYAGASALVFPSRHEGFGLPLVEAMANDTPIIASPEAASQEIAGDAVMRVDCSAAAPLADAIAQIVTDEALRERLIQRGRAQMQAFTIEACARATLQVYQEAVGIYASNTAQDTFKPVQPTVTTTDTSGDNEIAIL